MRKASFSLKEQVQFTEQIIRSTEALKRAGMSEAKALAGLMSFAAIGAIDWVDARSVAETLRDLADQIEADGAAKH
ncbi:hypothetical protein [Ensifer aridi]|uniref:hypothetical protein n=1 Tax=Ensifer aridi TaxID=1708715 RepID=UPI0004195D4D|nr:hypothetical protein [Ensifer aridi]